MREFYVVVCCAIDQAIENTPTLFSCQTRVGERKRGIERVQNELCPSHDTLFILDVIMLLLSNFARSNYSLSLDFYLYLCQIELDRTDNEATKPTFCSRSTIPSWFVLAYVVGCWLFSRGRISTTTLRLSETFLKAKGQIGRNNGSARETWIEKDRRNFSLPASGFDWPRAEARPPHQGRSLWLAANEQINIDSLFPILFRFE